MMIPAINWFDMLVVVLILLGVRQGRKVGMSGEVIGLMYWVSLALAAGLGHVWVGVFIQSKAPLATGYCLVIGYLLIAMVLRLIFERIKTANAEKLAKEDMFGGMEYYFGMAAGALRVACMVVVFIALLHGRYISHADRVAAAKVQRDSFGAVLFPTFVLFHSAVFYESLVGRMLAAHAGWLLVPAMPPGAAASLALERPQPWDSAPQ